MVELLQREREREKSKMKFTATYFQKSMRWILREGQKPIAQGQGFYSFGVAVTRAQEKLGVKFAVRTYA